MAPEVHPVKIAGKWIFPLAEGDLSQPGERRTTKTKVKVEDRPESEEDSLPVDDDEAGGDSEQEEDVFSRDNWIVTNDSLIRVHSIPRSKIFHPTEVECLIPLKYLDV